MDSTVLAKAVIPEPCSEHAISQLRGLAARGLLHAPSTVVAEVLGAIWRHVSGLRDMGVEEAVRAVERLRRLLGIMELHPSEELAREALHLAARTRLSLSEALYAVLAARLGEPLYTYDEALAGRLEEAGARAVLLSCGGEKGGEPPHSPHGRG